MISLSGGEVTLTISLSCTCRVKRAADAAVRADRVGLRLAVLVPRARGAHLVLGREHQRTRRAHLDAVAAVHAGRVGELDGELGRDAGVEAPPGDADGPRLLPLLAARVDALVAEDALGVVPHVQRVVDLHRLVDRLGRRTVGGVVVAGDTLVTRAVGHRGWAEPRRVGAVLGVPPLDVGRQREVDRRAEQLEHEPAAVPGALGVGAHDHARLDLARARRHEHPRALDLDHADPAGVLRR